MAGETRKIRTRVKVKEVPLATLKDDLSHYLREAEKGEIVITRHGSLLESLSGSDPKRIGLTTG